MQEEMNVKLAQMAGAGMSGAGAAGNSAKKIEINEVVNGFVVSFGRTDNYMLTCAPPRLFIAMSLADVFQVIKDNFSKEYQ